MPSMVAALFGSIAFVSLMIKVLLDSIHVGTTDPIYVLKISIMGAIVFGVIGFFLGRIFEEGQKAVEQGKRVVRVPDKELFLDDILVYDIGVPQKKPEIPEEKSDTPKK